LKGNSLIWALGAPAVLAGGWMLYLLISPAPVEPLKGPEVSKLAAGNYYAVGEKIGAQEQHQKQKHKAVIYVVTGSDGDKPLEFEGTALLPVPAGVAYSLEFAPSAASCEGSVITISQAGKMATVTDVRSDPGCQLVDLLGNNASLTRLD